MSEELFISQALFFLEQTPKEQIFFLAKSRAANTASAASAASTEPEDAEATVTGVCDCGSGS